VINMYIVSLWKFCPYDTRLVGGTKFPQWNNIHIHLDKRYLLVFLFFIHVYSLSLFGALFMIIFNTDIQYKWWCHHFHSAILKKKQVEKTVATDDASSNSLPKKCTTSFKGYTFY
jgi:hypothetical protein